MCVCVCVCIPLTGYAFATHAMGDHQLAASLYLASLQLNSHNIVCRKLLGKAVNAAHTRHAVVAPPFADNSHTHTQAHDMHDESSESDGMDTAPDRSVMPHGDSIFHRDVSHRSCLPPALHDPIDPTDLHAAETLLQQGGWQNGDR